MHHLLGIEQLSREDLFSYLDNAEAFSEIAGRQIKKTPALRGKTIVNLFLESSTRTRTSFEIAGKWLSADTINLSSSGSSTEKGENLRDTAETLQAMSPDVLVIRHKFSGACDYLAQHLTKTAIINAGDGAHEHPTQALLDCLTLRQHFHQLHGARDLQGLRVAIVGDIRHSRVARSTIFAHRILGNEITLVGPRTLVPDEFADERAFPGAKIRVEHNLSKGLERADVVMVLRMQFERQQDKFIPSVEEYCREYCVSSRLLDRVAPQAVILHPGPANRGLEISSELIDSERSLVRHQVANGVAIRMAVLFDLVSRNSKELAQHDSHS